MVSRANHTHRQHDWADVLPGRSELCCGLRDTQFLSLSSSITHVSALVTTKTTFAPKSSNCAPPSPSAAATSSRTTTSGSSTAANFSSPLSRYLVRCGNAGVNSQLECGTAANETKAFVRCCGLPDGIEIERRGRLSSRLSHCHAVANSIAASVCTDPAAATSLASDAMSSTSAFLHCRALGGRLCTVSELSYGGCACGTGCGHDNSLVWSGESCVQQPPPAPPPPTLPPGTVEEGHWTITLRGRYSYSHHGVFPNRIIVRGLSNQSFAIAQRQDTTHSCWINRWKQVVELQRNDGWVVSRPGAATDPPDAAWECSGGCLACSDQKITLVSAVFQVMAPSPPPAPPPPPTSVLPACVVQLTRQLQDAPLLSTDCASSGDTVPVGTVAVNATACERQYSVATLAFALPQVQPGTTIHSALLVTYVAGIRGMGIELQLSGLGLRTTGSDGQNASLANITSPLDFGVSSSSAAIATLALDGPKAVSLGTELRAEAAPYINSIVQAGVPAGSALLLRLTGSSVLGCDLHCDERCGAVLGLDLHHYMIDATRTSLTLIVDLAPPPLPPLPPPSMPLPPQAPPPLVCLDTCSFAEDGDCDDGGEGSSYSHCFTGTDCIDCGPRAYPPSPPPPPSPAAPAPARPSGYVYFAERVTQIEAASKCRLYGTALASIASRAEHDRLSSLGITDNAWIGLYSTDGFYFSWMDGTSLDYTNWRSNEPNNPVSERCVVVTPWRSLQWHDYSCHYMQGFVCNARARRELPAPPPPPPSPPAVPMPLPPPPPPSNRWAYLGLRVVEELQSWSDANAVVSALRTYTGAQSWHMSLRYWNAHLIVVNMYLNFAFAAPPPAPPSTSLVQLPRMHARWRDGNGVWPRFTLSMAARAHTVVMPHVCKTIRSRSILARTWTSAG